MAGNREYKSDVFSMLMEDRKNALQLYNALNDSDYDDPGLVEICTLDKGVSLSVRNDSAFVLDSNLSIYEHQSTICPNMPLRCLIYFTSIIEKIAKKHNIYGKTLIRIPTPKFAIFYNGAEEQPEQYELKLSDAFERTVSSPEIELTCRVYNINQGRNRELLEKCPILRDYMTFVDYVRLFHRQADYEHLETAISRAIDKCIEENVLRDFLIENRSEVIKVTQLDYTFDRQIELEREDARQEGWEAGRKVGWEDGQKAGRKAGWEDGQKAGRKAGWEDGQKAGRKAGWEDGQKAGRKAGWEDGQAEGEKRGQETAEVLNIKKLMENLGMTVDQAMDTLDITDDRKEKYRSMIGR